MIFIFIFSRSSTLLVKFGIYNMQTMLNSFTFQLILFFFPIFFREMLIKMWEERTITLAEIEILVEKPKYVID